MWKVLAPLIVLVIVLLIQLQVSESFVTSSTITLTTKDASGNTIDSSGNVVTTTSTSAPTASTISLTLADLLALFKAATPPPPVPSPPPAPILVPTPPSSNDIYNQIQPKLMNDVQGIMSTYMSGSPYTPAAPIPSTAPCSDAAAQGCEYQDALKDYIKKDEIPCYGCTL